MRIQTFTNGDIYGVKYSDRYVRTGVKVACAGSYDQRRCGFSINWVSTEGVANGYQVIRFPNIRDAEELAATMPSGEILRQRGTAEFVCLPIAVNDQVKWAWVNSKKLRYLSPSAYSRFRADYPGYVDGDQFGIDPLEPAAQDSQIPHQHRGFTF